MPIKISIPGSKSHSNRALILGTLSSGTITIKNLAICDDTNFMVANLKKLGVKIQQNGRTVKITGINKNGKLNFPKSSSPITLYTGNAGTTTRFLTALATLTDNEIIIDGDARMQERPIEELTKTLNELDAKIETNNGCPPLHIYPKILQGGEVNLPGNISSQYLSALLMVAPFAQQKIIINITEDLCSKPYIAMTLKVMKEFGLKVSNENFKKFTISTNQKPKSPKIYTIQSDASSASYFGAYAAIHPDKKILLKNIHKNSLQGDIKFLQYLKKMGCKIIENKEGMIIQSPQSKNRHQYPTLKTLGTIDMNETPDLVMTFSILTLFISGTTRITNIANLRIKETDRLSALENELKKLGATVKTGKDWIEIHGLVKNNRSESVLKNKSENTSAVSQRSFDSTKNKSPILIRTYKDHRIAMAFGILADRIQNLEIENPDCVSKSYPDFWKDLEKVQKTRRARKKHNSAFKKIPPKKTTTQAYHLNIILSGLRGSGKSTIGIMLAHKLSMNFIDTDEEIIKHENKEIPEIINTQGWEYFRTIESKIVQKVAKLKNTVIATGGGAILNPKNIKALQKNGKIIYLHVRPEIAAARILKDKNRPPLTNKKSVEEEMKLIYKDRHASYSKSADMLFKRSENTGEDCVRIIKIINKKINN